MGKLEGKIALVTGGNSGIGLAAAKRFVTEGAYVFITGRREPELAAAVKEIGSNATGMQKGEVRGIDISFQGLEPIAVSLEQSNIFVVRLGHRGFNLRKRRR